MSIARLRLAPGAPRLGAAVAAFAAGHTAVLIAAPGVPEAFLATAEAELAAPMTAVLGPDALGGLAVLGLTEIVPGLLAAVSFEAALRDALAADLAVVVMPEAPEPPHAGRRSFAGTASSRRMTPDSPALAAPVAVAPQDGLSGGTAFKTLEQFIIERQDEVPGSKGQFSRLLRDIAVAAKIVDRDVRKAGLVDLFGDTGDVNVQDEIQKKLDLLAHEEYVRALRRGGEVCMIGSEEHAEAIPLMFEGCQGKYVVLFDPLDGSSNIDVNVSIGTIFSVYQIPDDHVGHVTMASALQCGRKQVAAGYVIYGSSTMLVYTTGAGVNGFTLDPSIGEFLLSHPTIRTPATGTMYSANEGNYNSWEPGLKEYIKWMQTEDTATSRPYTTRYIGSFVADFHRNLVKGGIYIYPSNARSPQGKLRLMYEANPLAMIVEQAGGMASTGTGAVLDVEPEALHQRTPLYIGSRDMVLRCEAFLRGEMPA